MFGVYDFTGHGVPRAFMTSLAEHALDAGMAASRHEIKNLTVQARSSRMFMISSELW